MEILVEQFVLAILWGALMLTYLLGDVLRIFAGEFVPGEIDGKEVPGRMWILSALIMVIPIVMILLSLFVSYPYTKWISVVMSSVFFIFNLLGFFTYKPFDQFLLIISFIINSTIIYYAWIW
ncbi:hypothetical protein [Candidatus Xianfuyuplasma coldseepsis]|uniref:Uncharacterized protein n=1 Tax=Candidatus Xianfuyuplasma coldseepsis TaxID=2782163 RepID=A0A7L7KRS1_9MOLU|nr:hypothetical protein [Xianfuyuplasma coldseepsis]QMS85295.1 hypothetical protein G4Z02_05865 [Xianfuyuplasma coldseepsis]